MLIEEIVKDNQYRATKMDLSVDKIVDLLSTKCSKMVAAYQKSSDTIFRGIKGQRNSQDFFVSGLIRKDRQSLYMPSNQHKLISDTMEKMDLPSRRNSLFCTTRLDVAYEWGKPYILFVENGWTGLVFDKIKKQYAYDILIYDSESSLEKDTTEEQEQEMMRHLKKYNPRTFNDSSELLDVLNSKFYDILITGNRYYGLAIDTKDNRFGEILAEIGINKLVLESNIR